MNGDLPMEAIRRKKIVENNGEILLKNLPFEAGQSVEMILLPETRENIEETGMTARQLLQSEMVGLWEEREDIEDSSDYARDLREKAENRQDRA